MRSGRDGGGWGSYEPVGIDEATDEGCWGMMARKAKGWAEGLRSQAGLRGAGLAISGILLAGLSEVGVVCTPGVPLVFKCASPVSLLPQPLLALVTLGASWAAAFFRCGAGRDDGWKWGRGEREALIDAQDPRSGRRDGGSAGRFLSEPARLRGRGGEQARIGRAGLALLWPGGRLLPPLRSRCRLGARGRLSPPHSFL